MSTLKRLDRLDVATKDLADAARIYRETFAFAVNVMDDGAGATVKIGDAEIRLAAGASAAQQIAASGEGMFALWLEADDVEAVAGTLRKCGIEFGAIRHEAGRRVIAIDPKFASQVPLFIFDRRASGPA